MTIDTLGDRLNSGFCLRCGAVLMVVPWNDYQCCSTCTGIIEAAQEKAKRHRVVEKNKVGRKVVLRHQIARQIMPLKKG